MHGLGSPAVCGREARLLFLVQLCLDLAHGWGLQMIAEEENLARSTIKTHVTHIYQKLGVHTREELVLVVESVGE